MTGAACNSDAAVVCSPAMKLRAAVLLVTLSFFAPALGRAQYGASVMPEVLTPQQIEVRDVIAQPDRVQGVVVNHTDGLLKDVVLLVRYEWLWLNERNPGEDTMSFGDTVRVAGVPPGGTAGFSYMPTRYLPNRQDGYYKIGVSVQSARKSRVERTIFP